MVTTLSNEHTRTTASGFLRCCIPSVSHPRGHVSQGSKRPRDASNCRCASHCKTQNLHFDPYRQNFAGPRTFPELCQDSWWMHFLVTQFTCQAKRRKMEFSFNTSADSG